MTKQLFAWEIVPGDPDHMPAWTCRSGVVEAEPEELEALSASIGYRHDGMLELRPIGDATTDLDGLRIEIGRGLSLIHDGAFVGGPLCGPDHPFVDAYTAVDEWAATADDDGAEDDA
ncbi:MAG TPA: hypothetical protein VFI15_08385 [Candidatus Limnocylindrales bacterium]|nr:hypothetical protein [Candidatus Limnocylindrales bacterium]